jgi:glucose-6-phosphate isomerase
MMRTTTIQPAEPVRLRPDAALGALAGGNDRYEKALRDLRGVYRDERAFEAVLKADDGQPVYWVESSTLDSDDGALTVGVSSIRPGRIGDEYAMTRGHIHARQECAELYYGLSGHGVMLMETLAGETRAVEITPGVAVHVPGGWIHRSVNVGDELLTTLFCYSTTAGQDYGVIGDAGGMRMLVVGDGADGWALRENSHHTEYRR